jgi:hypothetical protein
MRGRRRTRPDLRGADRACNAVARLRPVESERPRRPIRAEAARNDPDTPGAGWLVRFPLRSCGNCARSTDGELRRASALIRRSEQHQQTLVNWLNPADQSPAETTIGYEQVAVEATSHVAIHEPDPYLAQIYRYGLLEDFDHLYRYSALLDRLEGKDANTILQSYTTSGPAVRRARSTARPRTTCAGRTTARAPPRSRS